MFDKDFLNEIKQRADAPPEAPVDDDFFSKIARSSALIEEKVAAKKNEVPLYGKGNQPATHNSGNAYSETINANRQAYSTQALREEVSRAITRDRDMMKDAVSDAMELVLSPMVEVMIENLIEQKMEDAVEKATVRILERVLKKKNRI